MPYYIVADLRYKLAQCLARSGDRPAALAQVSKIVREWFRRWFPLDVGRLLGDAQMEAVPVANRTFDMHMLVARVSDESDLLKYVFLPTV